MSDSDYIGTKYDLTIDEIGCRILPDSYTSQFRVPPKESVVVISDEGEREISDKERVYQKDWQLGQGQTLWGRKNGSDRRYFESDGGVDISEKNVITLAKRGALYLGHIASDWENKITSPDATDLASVINLAKELKDNINAHVLSEDVHTIEDTNNLIVAEEASDQSSANVLLNEIKGKYNTHRTQKVDSSLVIGEHNKGVHLFDDLSNSSTASNASNLSTSIALANNIKAKFNLHIYRAGVQVGLPLNTVNQTVPMLIYGGWLYVAIGVNVYRYNLGKRKWGPAASAAIGESQLTGNIVSMCHDGRALYVAFDGTRGIHTSPDGDMGTVATGSITVNSLPNENDTLVVGDQTYTFKAASIGGVLGDPSSFSGNTPFEIAIPTSETTEDMARNIRRAINRTKKATGSFGIKDPAIPSNGNKITINGQTYTFKPKSLSSKLTVNQVAIGDTVKETIRNLVRAVNAMAINSFRIIFRQLPQNGDTVRVGVTLFTWVTSLPTNSSHKYYDINTKKIKIASEQLGCSKRLAYIINSHPITSANFRAAASEYPGLENIVALNTLEGINGIRVIASGNYIVSGGGGEGYDYGTGTSRHSQIKASIGTDGIWADFAARSGVTLTGVKITAIGIAITFTGFGGAIIRHGGEGTDYGVGTTKNADVSATVNGAVVNLEANYRGTEGNSLPIITDGTRLTDTNMSGGTNIVFTHLNTIQAKHLLALKGQLFAITSSGLHLVSRLSVNKSPTKKWNNAFGGRARFSNMVNHGNKIKFLVSFDGDESATALNYLVTYDGIVATEEQIFLSGKVKACYAAGSALLLLVDDDERGSAYMITGDTLIKLFSREDLAAARATLKVESVEYASGKFRQIPIGYNIAEHPSARQLSSDGQYVYFPSTSNYVYAYDVINGGYSKRYKLPHEVMDGMICVSGGRVFVNVLGDYPFTADERGIYLISDYYASKGIVEFSKIDFMSPFNLKDFIEIHVECETPGNTSVSLEYRLANNVSWVNAGGGLSAANGGITAPLSGARGRAIHIRMILNADKVNNLTPRVFSVSVKMLPLDLVTSVDGQLATPRQWEFTINAQDSVTLLDGTKDSKRGIEIKETLLEMKAQEKIITFKDVDYLETGAIYRCKIKNLQIAALVVKKGQVGEILSTAVAVALEQV